MYIGALFMTAKTYKQPRSTVVHPHSGTLFSTWKEMIYQDMKRHGGALNAYY